LRLSFPLPIAPLLIAEDTLNPAYRWRLVDGFFANIRAPIEGCGAIAIVALAAWLRTGTLAYVAVLAMSLGLLAGRIAISLHYQRRVRSGHHTGDTPERWARIFMAACLLTASCWVALNGLGLLAHDAVLQIFIITVQSGWLSAAGTRNAASPAIVIWQAMIVLGSLECCVPLSSDHFLYILMPFGAIQFSASLGIAKSIGGQIAAALLAEQRLEAANARLTELSATDGLTGIANRRAFDAALKAEWGRAARDATDLALLVIDVDSFKAYNDCYGHPAGDDCLRQVAEITAQTMRRPPDTAARFGGEEFVALLPGTNLVGALDVAERVRRAIEAAGLVHRGSVFGCVTVSIGVASMAPQPGNEAQALIDLADKAVYEAKNGGRNQVRAGGPVLRDWVSGSGPVGPAAPGGR
jgi:diguanylate cyclase (GGDEF)-like protein